MIQKIALFIAVTFLFPTNAFAGEMPVEEERQATESLNELNERAGSASITEKEHTVLHKIIFYLPNRIIDLWDILRLDVGLGSSGGVVGRFTRYGQVGYRYVEPVSFRFGAQGRHVPIFVERYTEKGIGSDFEQSPNRYVTPYEVGIGVDALIVGAYAGLSFDEFVDFLGGWILLDPKEDDL